ncbi:hypothetical protein BDEG_20471 [Batrachochytrium dendrobatidis JEL423]|uniref:Dynein axonemal intermediate chain 4 n=1 Tax=Batrachochytrium dendrobatidis (strain JEL423) TaxID=403673 RepID=A0A177W870_BATDL|nr:hypothetical protein BDEG_20471 [Batrachochytrium dendrobatidis JEL423]
MDAGNKSHTKLGKSSNTYSSSHNQRSSSRIQEGQRSKNALNSSAVYGTSSRQNIRASHAVLDKRGAASSRDGPIVTIKDDDGNDVTPLSLMGKKPHHKDVGGVSTNDMSISNMIKETVSDVLNHLEQLTTSSWNSSAIGKSGASFVYTSHMASGSESIQEDRDDESSSATSADSGEESHLQTDVPSICVFSESTDEVTAIKASNAKYKELLVSRVNNDNFVERGMQTFNNAHKSKDIQATAQRQINAEVMVNQWEIYDAYNEESNHMVSTGGDGNKDTETEKLVVDYFMEQPVPLKNSHALIGASITSFGSQSIRKSESTFASLSHSAVGMNASNANNQVQLELAQAKQIAEKEIALNLKSDRLAYNLALMEQAVVGNNYEKKLLQYRNVPDAEMIEQKRVQEIMRSLEQTNEEHNLDNYDREEGHETADADSTNSQIPTLQLLWSYRCELTRGRSVMYMAWNRQNEWPERIYSSSSAVTSIDFSRMNPSLLAAGFFDGRVAIYDVRRKDNCPVLDDSDMNGKHHDPVWELKWVERERVIGDEHSRGEALVSVSTDGRVTQWIIRKGLEFTDLMTLKRLSKEKSAPAATGATTLTGNEKSNSFIARQTGGLCFDFNPKDSHNGPVVKVKWSPFLSGAFLSCSFDWTVRLWSQDSDKEVFKFQSGKDSVTDIAWSPHSSTCFGSVSSDGRLEIWDLEFSVLDPIINHYVLDRQLTSVVFASQSPTILTGDDYGTVTVYKICRNGNGGTGDEIASTTGIMDLRAGLNPYDETVVAWKSQESNTLLKIMAEKNSAGIAASGGPLVLPSSV